MRYIELDNTLPNQEFSFNTDNGTIQVRLNTIEDILIMSISANGKNIVNGIKVAPKVLLIGYKHIQDKYGDFIFSTTDDEYPKYTDFNSRNKLYWLNSEEIKEYK